MNTDLRTPKVYCFGEVLWDIFSEDEQYPGGAPLNVAYHLTKLAIPAGIISKIGTDPLGGRLETMMNNWGLKHILQSDSANPTGQVWPHINGSDEVTYEIVFPAAWDFIKRDHDTKAKVQATDYFIYGSLAARHSVSRKTLFELLDHANYKIFDLNLRPPFYENQLLERLLEKANLLKLNQSELGIIQQIFGEQSDTEAEHISFIKKKFNIQEVIVTKGDRGASYYTQDHSYHTDGISVNVSDTIGCGDSFLAAFVANHYLKKTPEVILKKATAMGAFIAGKKGGCPAYHLSGYSDFIKSKM